MGGDPKLHRRAVTTIDEIWRFWFDEAGPKRWYKQSDAFDDTIRTHFGAAHEAAAAGVLDDWRQSARGCVALCILLDQFPRNMFRGTARAFATDDLALVVAEHALAEGFDLDPGLDNRSRQFLYLPLEHSEDLERQRRCVRLTSERMPDSNFGDYAKQHHDVIERFGRFPHRNAVLGRPNTAAEEAYLSDGGPRFGQGASVPTGETERAEEAE